MPAKSSQYLKFTDESEKPILVPGECIDDEHYDEIDVSAWDWNVSDPSVAKRGNKANSSLSSAPARLASRDSTGEAGDKITPSRFRFSKRTDKSTTRLLGAMDKGEIFARVVLWIQEEYQKGDDYVPFQMKVTLWDAFVVEVDWSVTAADARVDMEEEWELNYAKIRIEYLYRGKDGKGWIPAEFNRSPELDASGEEKSPPSAAEQKAAQKKLLEDLIKSGAVTLPNKK